MSSTLLVARSARRAARTVLGPVLPTAFGQARHRGLAAQYRVSELIEHDGRVLLVWWPVQHHFGDLLLPWLFEKVTGKKVVRGTPDQVNYV